MSEEKKTCPGHERCPFCQRIGRPALGVCCKDQIGMGAWDSFDNLWYHDDECQGMP